MGSAHIASVSPFINEMSADMGVSVSVTGQLGSAQFIGALVSALALIPFISRIQLRMVLFLAAVTLAVATLITGSTLSFPVMFAARIIAGFAAGIAMAGALAALGRAWPDAKDRNMKTGLVVGSFAGGPGVVAPVMRLIAGPTSWQTAMLAFGILLAIIAMLVLIALPKLEGLPARDGKSLAGRYSESARVLLLPGIRPLLALRMLVWMAIGVSMFYLPAFFIGAYPGKEAWIGPVYAVVSLGGFMMGSIVNGLLISRVRGPVSILWPAGLLLPLGGIAFAWITPAPVVTTILFVAWAFVIGLHIPNCVSLLYVFAGRQQSSAVFADGAFQQIAALIGTVLGGLAIALAPGFVGWQTLVALISVASLLPLVLVVRQGRAVAAVEA